MLISQPIKLLAIGIAALAATKLLQNDDETDNEAENRPIANISGSNQSARSRQPSRQNPYRRMNPQRHAGEYDYSRPSPAAHAQQAKPMQQPQAESSQQSCMQHVAQEKPKTVVQTKKTYPKRGERFTDPDTGETLQVRAIGGRPRKHQPENSSQSL